MQEGYELDMASIFPAIRVELERLDNDRLNNDEVHGGPFFLEMEGKGVFKFGPLARPTSRPLGPAPENLIRESPTSPDKLFMISSIFRTFTFRSRYFHVGIPSLAAPFIFLIRNGNSAMESPRTSSLVGLRSEGFPRAFTPMLDMTPGSFAMLLLRMSLEDPNNDIAPRCVSLATAS